MEQVLVTSGGSRRSPDAVEAKGIAALGEPADGVKYTARYDLGRFVEATDYECPKCRVEFLYRLDADFPDGTRRSYRTCDCGGEW